MVVNSPVPNPVTSACLAALLQLCEQMVDRATAGDWNALEKLEQDRVSGLTSCLAQLDMGCHEQEISATLVQMIELNGQLVEVVSEAREDARTSLSEFRSDQNAISVYAAAGKSLI